MVFQERKGKDAQKQLHLISPHPKQSSESRKFHMQPEEQTSWSILLQLRLAETDPPISANNKEQPKVKELLWVPGPPFWEGGGRRSEKDENRTQAFARLPFVLVPHLQQHRTVYFSRKNYENNSSAYAPELIFKIFLKVCEHSNTL